MVVIGLAFVGSGLLARARRPGNRTGLLLMLVGLSWFGVALGSSDRSLVWADRVESLDGRLDVDSPPGAGTRLLAEIPCGHAAALPL